MKTAVIVPNWNGQDWLKECLDSLLAQSVPLTLVVVDNGSTDSSRDILESYGDKIVSIYRDANYGFTGGVNPGIEYAIEHDFEAVALFNNDAVAERTWLEELQKELKNDTGIVTCLFQSIDKTHVDSTGDIFTVWGVPYARGRGLSIGSYKTEYVFGASGGASIYSIPMLEEIGLFDQDYFAYFEDVDISFRAQLYGWKVMFAPKSNAYHRIGATSSSIKGFATYHSVKNWPLTVIKNVPTGLLRTVLPRFMFAYIMFIGSAMIVHRHPILTIKAFFTVVYLLPRKLRARRIIQQNKKVTDDYIFSIMTHDLPENSDKLRKLRSIWWKITGKK